MKLSTNSYCVIIKYFKISTNIGINRTDHLRISDINYKHNVIVHKPVTLARKIGRLTANLFCPYFLQSQMRNKHQHKNTTYNRRDKSSPLEPSNPITVDPQNCDINKAQIKDLKMVFINMINSLNRKLIYS